MWGQLHTSSLVFAAMLIAAGGGSAAAEVPRMVVGTTVGGVSRGFDDGENDTHARLGAEWRTGGRSALARGGYAGFNALIGVDYFGAPVDEVQDTEFLEGDLALPAGSNRLELAAAWLSSVQYAGDADAYAEPEWSILYRITDGRDAPKPYIGYRGSYRVESGGDDDRLTTIGVIGMDYEPSVRMGGGVELAAGAQRWPESEIATASGGTARAMRIDYLYAATGRVGGLLGYFLDWKSELSVLLRDSNADRYLVTVSELDRDSEDRIEAGASVDVRWTPTRRTGLSTGIGVTSDLYTDRRATTEDGTPRGENLVVTTVDGALGMDWTPDDRVFLVFEASGHRTVSSESALASWSFGADVGVEFVIRQ